MIPKFAVTLKEDFSIDIRFDEIVPEELILWVKTKLLDSFSGTPISPQVVRDMGDFVSSNLMQLLNEGSLEKDVINDAWILKKNIISWVNPNETGE